MRILTVWKHVTGIGEKCLLKEDGDYVGIDTGTLYKKEDGLRHSKQHIGIIRSVDRVDETGMIHLDQDSEDLLLKQQRLSQFIGCYVTLESAHLGNKVSVYRCRELNEYISSREVQILTTQEIRGLKIEKLLDHRKPLY